MNFIKRWCLTILCLLAAVGCYMLGIPAGGLAFLLLGAIFETAFWVRLYQQHS